MPKTLAALLALQQLAVRRGMAPAGSGLASLARLSSVTTHQTLNLLTRWRGSATISPHLPRKGRQTSCTYVFAATCYHPPPL